MNNNWYCNNPAHDSYAHWVQVTKKWSVQMNKSQLTHFCSPSSERKLLLIHFKLIVVTLQRMNLAGMYDGWNSCHSNVSQLLFRTSFLLGPCHAPHRQRETFSVQQNHWFASACDICSIVLSYLELTLTCPNIVILLNVSLYDNYDSGIYNELLKPLKET